MVLLLLSGCSLGTSTEKQLSDVMTTMNKSETDYKSAQKELTKLEKSEQKLFFDTMELTQEQMTDLQDNVAEMKKSLAKRKELVASEESAISKASKSSAELENVQKQSNEKDKKNIANLEKSISKRYENHTAFTLEYRALLKLQEELYEMLNKEESNLTNLKSKVKEVNKQNEVVQLAIAEFNESTVKVNKIKDDVFKSFKEE